MLISSTKYIFIDESGDLGRYGTNYFTIACVVVNDPKYLERIMKKLRRRRLKKALKELPEIKANNSNRIIREYVLRLISRAPCEIFAIVVDKSKIMPNLFDVKDRLYNFLCRILLTEIKSSDVMHVVIDKKHTNTLIRENFNEYIKNMMKQRKSVGNISIRHLSSYSSQSLQVVDFVAWSINRKFNYGDDLYYSIIKHKIKNRNRMELWS